MENYIRSRVEVLELLGVLMNYPIRSNYKDYWVISITPDFALDIGYTYAGGLGVLEGDKFYAAAKLGLKYIVLTLLYNGGYVAYDFDNGNPIPKPQPQPEEFTKLLSLDDGFKIRLKGVEVEVEALKYQLNTAKAIFFKVSSPDWAIKIIERLYIENSLEEKFLKYTLLAKASAEYLRRNMNLEALMYIDLQEAYAALLPLLLKIPGRYRMVIHTAGPWGHPLIPRGFFESEYGYRFLEPEVPLTEIGLAVSRQVFAVSAKHLDMLLKIFPHYGEKMSYVTNGVNIDRWMNIEMREKYENHELTLDEFVKLKQKAKEDLGRFIRGFKDVDLDGKLVVSWCRRLVPYKRPFFISRLIEELKNREIIFIIGGKAHPQDPAGLEYMKTFRKMHRENENVIYMSEYDVNAAKNIMAGSDLLLFTPLSGWEACGTSYMKAAINGTPTISSRDGGVIELIVDGVNGWLFGQDLREFIDFNNFRVNEINNMEYSEFRDKVCKVYEMYFNDPQGFYRVSLNALRSFIPRVSMERVLREYYPGLIRVIA